MVTAENLKNFNKHMSYLFEENRLATYKSKWIYKDSQICNASKMAEAGFIYIGSKHEPDAVQCFMCDKSLDGWDPDDDPWSEHLKHSANCSFAKLQQPEHALSFRQFLRLKDDLTVSLLNKLLQEKKDGNKSVYDALKKKISNV